MTRYTLIVGTRNWSSWSLRPFVALKATGAPFEIVDIRLRQTQHHPTTREQILTADGTVAAEAEAVLVARDRDTGETRALTDAERAAFER